MARKASHSEISRIMVGNTRQSDMNIYFWGANDDIPKNQTHGPVLRDHFLLLYCRTGHGTVTADGVEHPLEAGQCIMLFPNQTSSLHTDARSPWSIVWAGFRGMLLPYYLQRMGISTANPVFPWRNSEYILHHLMQIVNSEPGYSNSDLFSASTPPFTTGGELERLSSVYAVLSESYRLCSSFAELNSQSLEQEDYIQKAIAYMEENYNRRIKISDVAKHVGLNRSYLFTLFKENLSESPQEFLTRLRIKKACDMFRTPEATVSSVAFSLGYEPRALTRLFKQITGYTPTEYRRSIRDSQDK